MTFDSLIDPPVYYESYQFEGFRIPLEKSFLLSIPDLLEIRHVSLDATSTLIYYNVLLQGILMDPDNTVQRGGMVRSIYQTSIGMVDDWLDQIKNTPEDLFAAYLMVIISSKPFCELHSLTIPNRHRWRWRAAIVNSRGRSLVTPAALLGLLDIFPLTGTLKGLTVTSVHRGSPSNIGMR